MAFPNSSHLPLSNCLHLFHLNINSLYNLNKLTELTSLAQNGNHYLHVLGITESRLNQHISDQDIGIPDYNIHRRDQTRTQETGIAAYVHDTIRAVRRADLEVASVECLWLEIAFEHSKSLLFGCLYRHPQSRSPWFANFTEMMEKVWSLSLEIVLMGDFNLDFPHCSKAWEDTYTMFNLVQLVSVPTRVTSSSSTCLDHIYVNNVDSVKEISVPICGLSDHYPVCCSWSRKGVRIPRKHHITVSFRSFRHFVPGLFLADLASFSFQNVFSTTDPEMALQIWLDTYLERLNAHAPVRKRRVKSAFLPKWITPEYIHLRKCRDIFKRIGDMVNYRVMRNQAQYCLRNAKMEFISNLLTDKNNTKQIWEAINTAQNKKKKSSISVPSCLSADSFAHHFESLSVASTSSVLPDFSDLRHFVDTRSGGVLLPPLPFLSTFEVFSIISSLPKKSLLGLIGLAQTF